MKLDLARFEEHLRWTRTLLGSRFPGISYDFDHRLYRLSMAGDLQILLDRIPSDCRILDLGCGKGHLAAFLGSLGFPTRALDIPVTLGEQMVISRARWQQPLWREFERQVRNVRYGFYDGVRIPFRKGGFDAVMAYAVIEHVEPHLVRAWLREIRRVLTPQGLLFIFKCPHRLAPSEHLARRLGYQVHELLLNEGELKEHLREGGFEVLQSGRSDMIPAIPPPALKGVWDALAPLFLLLEKGVLATPLRRWSHHMWCIARPRGAGNAG